MHHRDEREVKYLLNHVIELLDSLPSRFCDEMQRREDIEDQKRAQEVKDEIEFMHEHRMQLNNILIGGQINSGEK